jgi:hypothetical protein
MADHPAAQHGIGMHSDITVRLRDCAMTCEGFKPLLCMHAELAHRLNPIEGSAKADGGSVLEPNRISAQVFQKDRSHFTLEIPADFRHSAPTRLTYERLEPASTTDQYSGYFLGSFGVHGPELLHLQRGLWDGEEAVIAHKVTGAHSL